jgi:hypothetical protein
VAQITVRRLRLGVLPTQAGAARDGLEDALRTMLPDDERLVLVRRMRVAAVGRSNPAHNQRSVHDGWQAAVGDARHAATDGAGHANCVWFASRAEAERLLLARLLAGHDVSGWFWPLALPDWRLASADDWLGTCLAEALACGDDHQLLALVETALAAGAIERVIAVLAAPMPGPWPGGRGAAVDGQVLALVPAAPDAPHERPAEGSPAHGTRAAEPTVAIPLAPAQRTVLARLLRSHGAASPAARALARALVQRHSPALALAPPRLEAAVRAVLAAAMGSPLPVPAPSPQQTPVSPDEARPSAGERAPDHRGPPTTPHDASRPQPEGVARAAPHLSPDAEPDRADLAPPAAEAPAETASPLPLRSAPSAHAGLWLVVPALIDAGFREWLMRHPDLLGDHPGRQLLLAVARRYRVAPGDPALRPLAPDDTLSPDWTRLWTIALDRWLRRRARIRLHDLLHRAGSLRYADGRADIDFPAQAADLRLRRHALDRDPGWTQWLGLAVRYHYRESGAHAEFAP